jgi:AraC family transcriptional regulator
MHFSRQFRLATGETPNAYVIRRKIEHAQQLLIDGSLCIADISAMLGFRSQSYFTMLFKRIIGETPARWRALSK